MTHNVPWHSFTCISNVTAAVCQPEWPIQSMIWKTPLAFRKSTSSKLWLSINVEINHLDASIFTKLAMDNRKDNIHCHVEVFEKLRKRYKGSCCAACMPK
jgi:hypothetical protein